MQVGGGVLRELIEGGGTEPRLWSLIKTTLPYGPPSLRVRRRLYVIPSLQEVTGMRNLVMVLS